ncbi:MAG: calcium-binding protein, partial [Gemmatimonadota bacterium]|nr:calcium-binding protein [Gemmatimonadota bacterium]
DAIHDGNVSYTILTAAAASGDANYSGLNPDDVSVTNNDDADTAGITVTPTSGLTTTEVPQSTDSFTVVLDSEPTADVVIGISSNDTTEGTVAPISLTFTSGNWDTPQTVTVTSVDDPDAEPGGTVYQIETAPATSTDTNYDGLDADDVSVTNTDT